ncbi:HAD family phosphatase [Candidatus Saccharibacteria bacterium]|nr:HAD family phosphatase [Candidatus Saccharibacteria bacterium]
MIKAILFDFFDVVRQDAFHAWMNNHGYTRDDPPGEVSRRMDLGEINGRQFHEELAQISGQTTEELRAEFAENEKFDQGVIDYIVGLRNEFKTALLSNAESDYLRNILKEKDLEKLFDVILISSETGYAKPDKEMFEMALEKLGVQPGEAVFVDDQMKNVTAAEKVGIHGIQFQTHEQLKGELEKIVLDCKHKQG